jgi:hypothetical protein
MNIGLVPKQEELISAVYACNHTLPAAMLQVRPNFIFILILWEVLQKNDYLAVALLGRLSFNQKEDIMSPIKLLNNIACSNKNFLSNLRRI